MKPIQFEIIRTGERVTCLDVRNSRVIDGVEFIPVNKAGDYKIFLMRKDALRKIKHS